MRKDSLLHFSLRHSLQKTTETLTSDEFLQNTSKRVLEAKNVDNQTLIDLAMSSDMQWAAYRIEKHLVSVPEVFHTLYSIYSKRVMMMKMVSNYII